MEPTLPRTDKNRRWEKDYRVLYVGSCYEKNTTLEWDVVTR